MKGRLVYIIAVLVTAIGLVACAEHARQSSETGEAQAGAGVPQQSEQSEQVPQSAGESLETDEVRYPDSANWEEDADRILKAITPERLARAYMDSVGCQIQYGVAYASGYMVDFFMGAIGEDAALERFYVPQLSKYAFPQEMVATVLYFCLGMASIEGGWEVDLDVPASGGYVLVDAPWASAAEESDYTVEGTATEGELATVTLSVFREKERTYYGSRAVFTVETMEGYARITRLETQPAFKGPYAYVLDIDGTTPYASWEEDFPLKRIPDGYPEPEPYTDEWYLYRGFFDITFLISEDFETGEDLSAYKLFRFFEEKCYHYLDVQKYYAEDKRVYVYPEALVRAFINVFLEFEDVDQVDFSDSPNYNAERGVFVTYGAGVGGAPEFTFDGGEADGNILRYDVSFYEHGTLGTAQEHKGATYHATVEDNGDTYRILQLTIDDFDE